MTEPLIHQKANTNEHSLFCECDNNARSKNFHSAPPSSTWMASSEPDDRFEGDLNDRSGHTPVSDMNRNVRTLRTLVALAAP